MSKNARRGTGKRQDRAPDYTVSQNFLTSRRLIDRLIRLARLGPGELVLDIGAGKGHLTRALAEAGCRVLASEIDPRLCMYLQEALRGYPHVRLQRGDFLRMPLPAEEYRVFANLPFCRTTAIVRKLTESVSAPKDAWLVMEKGAAMRFCGKPVENRSSLLLKPYYHGEIVYHFRREDFHPAPAVDTVMLHLSRRAEPDLPTSERRAFAAFIEHVQQYGLAGSRKLLSKKQITTALRLANLPPLKPSGTMQYVQWLCLFRCYRQFGTLPRFAGKTP